MPSRQPGLRRSCGRATRSPGDRASRSRWSRRRCQTSPVSADSGQRRALPRSRRSATLPPRRRRSRDRRLISRATRKAPAGGARQPPLHRLGAFGEAEARAAVLLVEPGDRRCRRPAAPGARRRGRCRAGRASKPRGASRRSATVMRHASGPAATPPVRTAPDQRAARAGGAARPRRSVLARSSAKARE